MAASDTVTDWAENYVRQHHASPTNGPDALADEFLTRELKKGDRPPYISTTALSAIEICKGGEPVDLATVKTQLNQEAIKILDTVVIEGGNGDDGFQTDAFDVARVDEAIHEDLDARVVRYADRIRRINEVASQIGDLCDNRLLTGSLLRLLAIRDSRRLWLLHEELGSHASKDWDFRQSDRIDAGIAGLLNENNTSIQSFLSQLSTGIPQSRPVVRPPSVSGPKNPDINFVRAALIALAIAPVMLVILVSNLNPQKRRPQNNWQPVVKPDPMSGFRAVQKFSAYGALEDYLDDRSLNANLWTAVRRLKEGIISTDTSKFVDAKKMLRSTNVQPEAIDRYVKLRKIADDKRQLRELTEVKLEKAMQKEWAEWFDALPSCEETDERFTGVAIVKKVTQLEIELLNRWKEENGLTNKVLEILQETKKK
jgi:hypothetical protein